MTSKFNSLYNIFVLVKKAIKILTIHTLQKSIKYKVTLFYKSPEIITANILLKNVFWVPSHTCVCLCNLNVIILFIVHLLLYTKKRLPQVEDIYVHTYIIQFLTLDKKV